MTARQLQDQATEWRLAAEAARERGDDRAAERAERNARSADILAQDVARNPLRPARCGA